MSGYMPVEVPRGAFLFCRWSVALLLWAGAIARIEALVGFCAAVMALSAILTVGRAPLITLYALTVERIRPSRVEILDRNGMRFAHTVGDAVHRSPVLRDDLGELAGCRGGLALPALRGALQDGRRDGILRRVASSTHAPWVTAPAAHSSSRRRMNDAVSSAAWGVRPVLLRAGGLAIPSYEVFVGLALLAGVMLFLAAARRHPGQAG